MTDWKRELPPERVAAAARTDSAAYRSPSALVRLVGPVKSVPLHPRTIIEVGGLLLAESVDEPDNWFLGQPGPDGGIECWGAYGELQSALRGL